MAPPSQILINAAALLLALGSSSPCVHSTLFHTVPELISFRLGKPFHKSLIRKPSKLAPAEAKSMFEFSVKLDIKSRRFFQDMGLVFTHVYRLAQSNRVHINAAAHVRCIQRRPHTQTILFQSSGQPKFVKSSPKLVFVADNHCKFSLEFGRRVSADPSENRSFFGTFHGGGWARPRELP